jgi:hypothetical protein
VLLRVGQPLQVIVHNKPSRPVNLYGAEVRFDGELLARADEAVIDLNAVGIRGADQRSFRTPAKPLPLPVAPGAAIRTALIISKVDGDQARKAFNARFPPQEPDETEAIRAEDDCW